VIASGLARGIDTRAHRAALGTGTVAVLAGGHDRVYPDENKPLLERLAEEGGAVVSEMPLGWEPRGRDFPRRNRLVSGLAYGVVVVEAARRSGSLITARFALEQGREVFAVPGSPLDPRAEGTNDLIRGGATLCSRAADVISVLEPLLEQDPDVVARGLWREAAENRYGAETVLWDEFHLGEREAVPSAGMEQRADGPADDRERVLEALGISPVSVDDLSRQSGVPVRTVHLVLVELELAGRIERAGGSAVSLLLPPT